MKLIHIGENYPNTKIIYIYHFMQMNNLHIIHKMVIYSYELFFIKKYSSGYFFGITFIIWNDMVVYIVMNEEIRNGGVWNDKHNSYICLQSIWLHGF